MQSSPWNFPFSAEPQSSCFTRAPSYLCFNEAGDKPISVTEGGLMRLHRLQRPCVGATGGKSLLQSVLMLVSVALSLGNGLVTIQSG